MATPASTERTANRTSVSVPRIAVADLLGAGREVVLLHDGTEYRLRLTSNGKLILTK